jgi:hypothetical protein
MAVESRLLYQLLIRAVPCGRRERLCGTMVIAPVLVEVWMPVVAIPGSYRFIPWLPCLRTLCTVVHIPFVDVDVIAGAHVAPSCV